MGKQAPRYKRRLDIRLAIECENAMISHQVAAGNRHQFEV